VALIMALMCVSPRKSTAVLARNPINARADIALVPCAPAVPLALPIAVGVLVVPLIPSALLVCIAPMVTATYNHILAIHALHHLNAEAVLLVLFLMVLESARVVRVDVEMLVLDRLALIPIPANLVCIATPKFVRNKYLEDQPVRPLMPATRIHGAVATVLFLLVHVLRPMATVLTVRATFNVLRALVMEVFAAITMLSSSCLKKPANLLSVSSL